MSGDSERSTATPSTDPINLSANAWMESFDLERLSEIASPGSTRGTSRIARSAAHVQALAARLGKDAEELASRIPADTLRRLKYPVLAHENPDGSVSYTRDPGIVEGVISTVGKDFSPMADKKFDSAKRDSRGRYTK